MMFENINKIIAKFCNLATELQMRPSSHRNTPTRPARVSNWPQQMYIYHQAMELNNFDEIQTKNKVNFTVKQL